MSRLARKSTNIGVAALGCAILAVTGSTAAAGEMRDPFAGLQAIEADSLAELHGREGISLITNLLQGSQSFDIESANKLEAGVVKSGLIGLNGSFNNARGVNSIVANTGMGANVQNGLILLINLH